MDLKKFEELWEKSPTPSAWAEQNEPDANLVWRDGCPAQVRDLLALAQLSGTEARVVGHHTSKSVRLPVGMLHFMVWGVGYFILMRNNFHDIKVQVLSDQALPGLPRQYHGGHYLRPVYFEGIKDLVDRALIRPYSDPSDAFGVELARPGYVPGLLMALRESACTKARMLREGATR